MRESHGGGGGSTEPQTFAARGCRKSSGRRERSFRVIERDVRALVSALPREGETRAAYVPRIPSIRDDTDGICFPCPRRGNRARRFHEPETRGLNDRRGGRRRRFSKDRRSGPPDAIYDFAGFRSAFDRNVSRCAMPLTHDRRTWWKRADFHTGHTRWYSPFG